MTIASLTLLGTLASVFYVFTWTPSAVKARRRRGAAFTWFELVDFAALPIGICLLYLLSSWNIFRVGIQSPHDNGVATARIFTTILFDTIVFIRAIRWIKTLATTGEPADVRHLRVASSDHELAAEGTHDHQNLDPR